MHTVLAAETHYLKHYLELTANFACYFFLSTLKCNMWCSGVPAYATCGHSLHSLMILLSPHSFWQQQKVYFVFDIFINDKVFTAMFLSSSFFNLPTGQQVALSTDSLCPFNPMNVLRSKVHLKKQKQKKNNVF